MDIFQKPINTYPFRDLVDKRPTSALPEQWPVPITEVITIGPGYTGDVCIMRLKEIPLKGVGMTGATGDVTDITVLDIFGSYDGIISGVPATRQFLADSDTYKFGYLEFSASDVGQEVTVLYYGRGSIVFASDVNELATGELLKNGSVRPRHIFQGGTGPDGKTGTSDFVFATDVAIGGDLNVIGDLNIEGVVNKSVSEVIDITDDIIMLNSGATGPGPDVGLEIDRGPTAGNPMFVWDEGDDAWQMSGISGDVLLSIYDNKTVKVIDGGLFKPPTWASDPIPTVAMIPGIFYNSTDRQYKGIVSDGVTGAEIVILG